MLNADLDVSTIEMSVNQSRANVESHSAFSVVEPQHAAYNFGTRSPVTPPPSCVSHDSLPRQRSRASSRATTASPIADFNWVGEFVNRVANDAQERERRLMDITAAERQRMTEVTLEKERLMAEVALEREQRLAAEAAARETRMREDLRELAVAQARAAVLEEQLRAKITPVPSKIPEKSFLHDHNVGDTFSDKIAAPPETDSLSCNEFVAPVMSTVHDPVMSIVNVPAQPAAMSIITPNVASNVPFAAAMHDIVNVSHVYASPAFVSLPATNSLLTDVYTVQSVAGNTAQVTLSSVGTLPTPMLSVKNAPPVGQNLPEVKPSVLPWTTTPFVVPQHPPWTSTTLVPLSSIQTENFDTTRCLKLVNAPSGPMVQVCPLPQTTQTSSSATVNPVTTPQTPAASETASNAISQPVASVFAPSPTSPLSATPPVVMVQNPQAVRPYNGSTSWKSFMEHFERVAKVNGWTDHVTKAQHVALALEGPAADVLKEIDETQPGAYGKIWNELSRRFGDIDEDRVAIWQFEMRKQLEHESVVEYEQALRTLYTYGWPKASAEQKDQALKVRFENGLLLPEMTQYLRLHARDDSFSETVQKARRFAATLEQPKTKKTVRFSTPPPHETVKTAINAVHTEADNTEVINKIEKLEDMIRSIQRAPSPSPKSQRPQNSGTGRSNSPDFNSQQHNWQQNNANGQRPQTRTFDNRQRPATRTANDNSPSASPNTTRRPPGTTPGCCWICRQPGCHSRNHEHVQGQQFRPRTFGTCWICGNRDCRSWYHDDNRPTTPPVPPLRESSQGNDLGTRYPGTRAPAQPARPTSR